MKINISVVHGSSPMQNFEFYNLTYAFVGRTIQVGAVTGIISAFNHAEDAFEVQLPLSGPKIKIPRQAVTAMPTQQGLASSSLPNTYSGISVHNQPHPMNNPPRNLLIVKPANNQTSGNPLLQSQVMLKQNNASHQPISWLPFMSDGFVTLDNKHIKESSSAIEFFSSNAYNQAALLSRRPDLGLSSSAKRINSNATTKTGVFRIMHSCYRSMSGINGRQDAYYGAHSVPTYDAIEAALAEESTINAARISTLRSRYLMAATLDVVRDRMPCAPEKYVINSITTACPMCGRAIALNKLASHENWCKHLECSHGQIGASIAARFRAHDKNIEIPPPLRLDINEFTEWVDVEFRSDMAPLDSNVSNSQRKLVPFTSKLFWHAVMLHQLILEGALSSRSVLVQELTIQGLKHFHLTIDPKTYLKELYGFQKDLSRFAHTFEAYAKEHIDVITCEHQSNEPYFWFKIIENCYKEHEPNIPEFKVLEDTLGKHGGERAVNAHRLIVLRQRQLLREVFEKAGFGNESSTVGKFVINALVVICPFCCEEIRCIVQNCSQNGLFGHFSRNHGKIGKLLAEIYMQMDLNEIGTGNSNKDQLPKIAQVPERPDVAWESKNESHAKSRISFAYEAIDWRALLFDKLLHDKVLTSYSVLTQEIVVIGLFYFGLVNQRSPQKFGQYPQLQAFQRGLHEFSSVGYDIYCGAGIKEGELGSSHTRGRPVQATKDVIHRYHHYGLSHKSLQRNDRKRNSRRLVGEANQQPLREKRRLNEAQKSKTS